MHHALIEKHTHVCRARHEEILARSGCISRNQVVRRFPNPQRFESGGYRQRMRRNRRRIVVRKHIPRNAMRRTHRRRRNRDHSCDSNACRHANRNRPTHRMPRKHRALRINRPPRAQLLHQSARASLRPFKRKRPRRTSMPRQVRHKNAQILASKAPRQVRHDFLVSGQPVKQHNEAPPIVSTLIDYVSNQPAPSSIDHHRNFAIRRGTRRQKPDNAKHNRKRRTRTLSPFHRVMSPAARRNTCA